MFPFHPWRSGASAADRTQLAVAAKTVKIKMIRFMLVNYLIEGGSINSHFHLQVAGTSLKATFDVQYIFAKVIKLLHFTSLFISINYDFAFKLCRDVHFDFIFPHFFTATLVQQSHLLYICTY